jgi:O-antigen/teichoic acid export membrane protein
MIKINLKTQLNRNIASGSIVHGLNIFIVLFSYPIFIHYLGFELFSVWVLLSIIISFAQIGDFGISKAVIFYTAKEKTLSNYENIKKLLSSAIFLLIILSLIIQLVLWVFKNQIVSLLAVPPEYIEQSVKVIPLIGISVFTFLIYDSLAGIITGLGRLDQSNLLLLILNILKVGFTIMLLINEASVLSMVLGVILSNVILILIVFVIISRKYFNSGFPLTKLSLQTSNKILKYGFPVLGVQILNMLMFPVIKVIMANYLGVIHVGFFELATKAAYSLRTFFEKGLFALMPEFSKLHITDDKENMNKIRAKVNAITKKLLYFGLPLFILFSALSPILLKFWLNESYNLEILKGFLILQPGIIIGLFALPSYYALLATKNQDKCFYEALIRTILSITLIYLYIHVLTINELVMYVLISISVIISNIYIIFIFRKKTLHA